jgi:hypothetical protein
MPLEKMTLPAGKAEQRTGEERRALVGACRLTLALGMGRARGERRT